MHNHTLVITQLTTVLMTIFLSGSLLQASEEKTSQTVFYAEDIKEEYTDIITLLAACICEPTIIEEE